METTQEDDDCAPPTPVLVAGVTTAMSADQGSDEAPGYALSLKMARSSGPYASARMPGHIRNSTFNIPTQYDPQLDGR
jgi:hypothetical protein